MKPSNIVCERWGDGWSAWRVLVDGVIFAEGLPKGQAEKLKRRLSEPIEELCRQVVAREMEPIARELDRLSKHVLSMSHDGRATKAAA